MFVELGNNLINLAEILCLRPYGEKCTDIYFKGKENSLLVYMSYQEALKIIKAALAPVEADIDKALQDDLRALELGGLEDVKPQ